jgi:hypothetical protein
MQKEVFIKDLILKIRKDVCETVLVLKSSVAWSVTFTQTQ